MPRSSRSTRFNKSHSAAYAILVMRTAYLKSHYPNEYMAAVLSSYMGNADKLIKYIASCTHSGHSRFAARRKLF